MIIIIKSTFPCGTSRIIVKNNKNSKTAPQKATLPFFHDVLQASTRSPGIHFSTSQHFKRHQAFLTVTRRCSYLTVTEHSTESINFSLQVLAAWCKVADRQAGAFIRSSGTLTW